MHQIARSQSVADTHSGQECEGLAPLSRDPQKWKPLPLVSCRREHVKGPHPDRGAPALQTHSRVCFHVPAAAVPSLGEDWGRSSRWSAGKRSQASHGLLLQSKRMEQTSVFLVHRSQRQLRAHSTSPRLLKNKQEIALYGGVCFCADRDAPSTSDH